ncbi:MAG TPA: SDR family NAD(P)-dependent oxidoreductase [Candidatus Limnocylindrales bacterium]|nr:SDR family NAD(P)-dependent oxidoreductase [Candidatus Limnocylindrales bacterium]
MSKSADPGIAVVAGATGVLGPAVARALAKKGGYRVALLARDADRLAEVAAGLPGGPHLVVPVDLTSTKDAARAAAKVVADLGVPRVLVHAIGTWRGGAGIAETSIEDWNTMLRTNLWTAIHAYRRFLPHLLAASDPRIVAISTPDAAKPGPTNAAHAASKAALEALTLAAGRELATVGGSANLIVIRSIRDPDEDGRGTPAKAIASTIVRLCAPGRDEGAVTGRRIDLT